MAFSIKEEGMGNFWIAYLLMNLIGLFYMYDDKQRAIKHQYRIRERTLWLIALFGGAVGATVGMQLFRHKTKHLSFKFGFPLLACFEIIIITYFYVQK
jgi:uncharacterized membrane protein YsdA (DUF1294 family)